MTMTRAPQTWATWEYREFDMPTENEDRVFLDWLREGWEVVGVHPKGKGQRKPMPVAIVRRELEPLAS